MCALIAAGCGGMGAGKEAPPPAEEPPPAVEVPEEPAPPPEPEEPEPFVHTVSFQGETLSLIAKWYTGRQSNWREVAAANPGIDPNRIFLGNQVVIPEELLVTRDPLPQSFVQKHQAPRKAAQ